VAKIQAGKVRRTGTIPEAGAMIDVDTANQIPDTTSTTTTWQLQPPGPETLGRSRGLIRAVTVTSRSLI
jgi:hypothetical protein